MNGDKEKDAPPTGWNFHGEDQAGATGATTAPQPEEQQYNTVPTAGAATAAVADQTASTAPVERRRTERPALKWTAGDVTRQRPAGWMAMVVGGSLVLAAVAYLITRDIFTAVIIPVAALLFSMYSVRKPQMLNYQLDGGGIVIGQRRYAYSQFRSFAIEQDGPVHDIILMPLTRFMPEVTVSYRPELEDDIVAMLAERLPMEALRRDAMDMLIRKLRF